MFLARFAMPTETTATAVEAKAAAAGINNVPVVAKPPLTVALRKPRKRRAVRSGENQNSMAQT